MTVLEQINDRMSCPNCRADLELRGDILACVSCDATFPIRDGIPLLAIRGSAETWSEKTQAKTSDEYQLEYQEVTEAAKYNQAYQNKLLKRWTTTTELKLLEGLLAGLPHCETLLNIPSGGGRLSEVIAAHTDTLIEADIAVGQVQYAREQAAETNNRLWMTASAFHIPLKDNSVDGIVCCRLCHHMPTAIERERLLGELLRVARSYVVMTFFDYHSVKNYLRRFRRPFNKKEPKMTMTRGRVAELAEQHGAKLIDDPSLAYFSSGHRFAVMVKRDSQA